MHLAGLAASGWAHLCICSQLASQPGSGWFRMPLAKSAQLSSMCLSQPSSRLASSGRFPWWWQGLKKRSGNMQVYVQVSTYLMLATVHLTKANHMTKSRVSVREIDTGKCKKLGPLLQSVCHKHILCVSCVLDLMLLCRYYLPVNLLPAGWMLWVIMSKLLWAVWTY